MPGKHKFHVGQRVRFSEEGIRANVHGRTKPDTKGTVTVVDKHNSPTVKWDTRKTADSYAPWFIEPVSARRKGETG